MAQCDGEGKLRVGGGHLAQENQNARARIRPVPGKVLLLAIILGGSVQHKDDQVEGGGISTLGGGIQVGDPNGCFRDLVGSRGITAHVLGKGSPPCALATDQGYMQRTLGGICQSAQVDLFDVVPDVCEVFYSSHAARFTPSTLSNRCFLSVASQAGAAIRPSAPSPEFGGGGEEAEMGVLRALSRPQ